MTPLVGGLIGIYGLGRVFRAMALLACAISAGALAPLPAAQNRTRLHKKTAGETVQRP